MLKYLWLFLVIGGCQQQSNSDQTEEPQAPAAQIPTGGGGNNDGGGNANDNKPPVNIPANNSVASDETQEVKIWLAGPLPSCDPKRQGAAYYVREESTFKYCDGSNWAALDLKGPQGAVGSAGPQGAAGPQGPQGLAGVTGPQGPQGATGLQGPTGQQGPQGVQGATGPQGPQGATGPTGPQGTQGLTGPQGAQGLPGSMRIYAANGDLIGNMAQYNYTVFKQGSDLIQGQLVERNGYFAFFQTSSTALGLYTNNGGGPANYYWNTTTALNGQRFATMGYYTRTDCSGQAYAFLTNVAPGLEQVKNLAFAWGAGANYIPGYDVVRKSLTSSSVTVSSYHRCDNAPCTTPESLTCTPISGTYDIFPVQIQAKQGWPDKLSAGWYVSN